MSDKIQCQYCGRAFIDIDNHNCKLKVAYKIKEAQKSESSGDKSVQISSSTSIQQKTPAPDDTFYKGDFPSVEKVSKPTSTKTTKSTTKEGTVTTGGGELFGFAEFLLTAKDWINSFWTEPPLIKLTEKTAYRLEKQFNKAFGEYVTPIMGFAFSMLLVFGLPILIHTIGKEMVMDMWNKFQSGWNDKFKSKDKDTPVAT